MLLICVIESLCRHEILLFEGSVPFLPSQLTREKRELPNPAGKSVVLGFEGPIFNIHTTRVVRLMRSAMFTFRQDGFWRNAAIFESSAGGRHGFFLSGDFEHGRADLTLFFNGAPEATMAPFASYGEEHLERSTISESVS